MPSMYSTKIKNSTLPMATLSKNLAVKWTWVLQNKREKMHIQRRYATCSQGMSKTEEKKKKERERKKKDSPCPQRKRKEIRELVHTKEFILHPPKISTYLHILIRLHDLFLLRFSFWLGNIWKASMPLYPYPELHISLIRGRWKRRHRIALVRIFFLKE